MQLTRRLYKEQARSGTRCQLWDNCRWPMKIPIAMLVSRPQTETFYPGSRGCGCALGHAVTRVKCWLQGNIIRSLRGPGSTAILLMRLGRAFILRTAVLLRVHSKTMKFREIREKNRDTNSHRLCWSLFWGEQRVGLTWEQSQVCCLLGWPARFCRMATDTRRDPPASPACFYSHSDSQWGGCSPHTSQFSYLSGHQLGVLQFNLIWH